MSGYYGPAVENDVVMDAGQHIRDEITQSPEVYGLDEAQVAAVKALDDDVINEAINAATHAVEGFWPAYQQVRSAAVAALVKQAPTELVVRWTSTVEETHQTTLTGAEVAEYQRLLAEDDVDMFLADREGKAIEVEVTDRHVEGGQ
jgi:hypothetical protein